MEKRLIVTRADGNIADMMALTHPSIKAYAKRCGADFLVLDEDVPFCSGVEGCWCYRIFHIKELLQDYDRVLNIDTDVLVKADCPDLFELVPSDEIGVIYEDVGTRQEHRRLMMTAVQADWGDIGWTEGYINSGISLWSKKHADVFELINGEFWRGWGLDDVHLGYQIHRLGHKVFELDPRFNWMSLFSENYPSAERPRDGAYIVHYAGEAAFPDKGDRDRLTLIHDDALRWGLLAEDEAPAKREGVLKIVLAGVFSPESTDVVLADDLAELGHRVQKLAYRDVIRSRGIDELHKTLLDAGQGADVVVICKGAGANLPAISPGVLSQIACRSVYWCPDNIDVAGEGLVLLARACDVVCSPCKRSCEAFRDAGCPNVNQIFMTFSAKTYFPQELDKKRNVVFLGVLDEKRHEIIERLRKDGITVETPEAWLKDAAKVIGESKISLNFARGELVSNRVFWTMASGTFLLTEDCQDLHAAFEPGKHFVTWTEYDELREAIEHWLGHDEEREAIAAAGCEAVQPYESREQAAKLVRAIRGEQITDGAFEPGDGSVCPVTVVDDAFVRRATRARVAVVSFNCCVRASQTALALQKAGYDARMVVHYKAEHRQFNDDMDSVSIFFSKEQMLRTLDALQPDIIHIHDRPHQLASDVIRANLGVPVVNDVHDMDSLLRMPMGEPMHEPFSLQHADGLVFVSEPYRQYAEKWYGPLPPSIVVPSMVCESLMPEKRRPRVGAACWEGGLYVHEPGDPRRYIDQRDIAARLVGIGQSVFLHSAPNGYPENVQPYNATGAIVFAPVPYVPLLAILTSYDWLWYGQVEDSEQIHSTLPNKLFDAVAAGLPVVVIKAREAGRYVEEHELGISIERPEQVRMHKDRLEQLREEMWTRRKRFTREKAVLPLLELYDDLLGKNKENVL